MQLRSKIWISSFSRARLLQRFLLLLLPFLSNSSVFPPDCLSWEFCSSPQKYFNPLQLQCWKMSCATGVHNRTVTCFKVPSRGRFSNWVCPLSRALQIVTQWGNFRWAFTIETRTLWLCFSSYISLIQFLNRLANWHANIKDWKLRRVQRLWLKATAFHRSDCKCTEKIAVWCFCCFVPVTPAARLWECHSINILIVRPTDNPILQLM